MTLKSPAGRFKVIVAVNNGLNFEKNGDPVYLSQRLTSMRETMTFLLSAERHEI